MGIRRIAPIAPMIESLPSMLNLPRGDHSPRLSVHAPWVIISAIMAGQSYLIFRDIEGKLDVLSVECTKCARKGRYSVSRLIEKYGRKANMMKWKEQLNGDCPRRDAHSMHKRCDLVCPDLPKVL